MKLNQINYDKLAVWYISSVVFLFVIGFVFKVRFFIALADLFLFLAIFGLLCLGAYVLVKTFNSDK